MKSTLAVALIGLAVMPLVGCQAWIPPHPERDAAVATGVADAIEFHHEGLPDQDPRGVSNNLTLPDAVRRALQSHPSIQAALAAVRVAEAEAAQTRLLPNPIINLAFRLPESGGPPIVAVSLAAELLSLVQKPGQVRVADFRLRAASAQAVIVVLDVVTEVRQRYAAVQALDALMPVLEEREKLLDRLLAIAESRLRAGEGIRLDVTTLEAQRAELDVEMIEQRAERRQQRLQLSRSIGQPLDAARWTVTPWTEAPVVRTDEAAWIRTALEHRPELQAKLWELSALGVEVGLARWAFIEGGEADVEAERDGTWSTGPSIGVPIPIFDWGQAQRAKAQALRTQTLHEMTDQRRTVIEEIRTAREALQASLEAYRRVRDGVIPLLEKRRREATSQWEAGQSDILPLILAEQDLEAAKARRIEFERKATEALIHLERAVGGPAYVPAGNPSTDLPATPITSPKE